MPGAVDIQARIAEANAAPQAAEEPAEPAEAETPAEGEAS